MRMYTLTTSATFDSAHFLHGYNGKCANLHGHTWKIEASITADTLQETGDKRGMVIDFSDFKREVQQLASSFDHGLIYEEGSLQRETIKALQEEGFRLIPVPFRPTAECFAHYFYDCLHEQGLPVRRVAVYETPNNCAQYEEV